MSEYDKQDRKLAALICDAAASYPTCEAYTSIACDLFGLTPDEAWDFPPWKLAIKTYQHVSTVLYSKATSYWRAIDAECAQMIREGFTP